MYDSKDEHLPGHVTVSEARQAFADLVNRAAFRGERIRVMRHGHAVAAIVPIEDVERLERLDAAGETRSPAASATASEARELGEQAVALLREHGREIRMTTDEILALTRRD